MKAFFIIIFCLPFLLFAQNHREIAASVEDVATPPPTKPNINLATLKAFPGAEGYGSLASGGRGGYLIIVNDKGPNETGAYDAACDCYKGTFRYALTRPFAGMIVFRVSGTIVSTNLNDYRYSGQAIGNKTIVGATAPFPGLILNNARFSLNNNAGNWIIRGLTILTGQNGTPAVEVPLSISGQENVILADNTVGWGWDQALDMTRTESGTAQYNLVIENTPSHNTGSIIGNNVADVEGSGGINPRISWHHNGYIWVSHRFPNIAGNEFGNIDIYNNFAYGYSARLVKMDCNPRLNHVGNYYKPEPGLTGLDTRLNKWGIFTAQNPNCGVPNQSFYTAGNRIVGYFDTPTNNNQAIWQHFQTGDGYTQNTPLPSSFFRSTAWPYTGSNPVTVSDVNTNYTNLIVGKNLGARYYTDSNGIPHKYFLPFIDQYLEDAINGTSLAYRNDSANFIIPTLPALGSPYLDTDQDGMPDSFEDAHGLDKNNRNDAKATNKVNWEFDNYTVTNTAGFENREIFFFWIQGDLQKEFEKL